MIYVDDLKRTTPDDPTGGRWHYQRYCRLYATKGEDELHWFAEILGLKRAYFVAVPGFPQYHLTATMRHHALREGATAVSSGELCRIAGVLR